MPLPKALLSAAIAAGLMIFAGPAVAQNHLGSATGVSGADVESAAGMEMMKNSTDSEKDLKEQMTELQKNNERKKAQRDAHANLKDQQGKLKEKISADGGKTSNAKAVLKQRTPPLEDEKDSLSDMSQQDQMKMQEAHGEREDKASQTLSNILKKNQDTNSSLTNNMK